MKLLVFRTDRLGEFLLTLPAMKILKDFYKCYGEVTLTLVLSKSNVSLLPAVPWVDDFIVYESFWPTFRRLVYQRPDVAIVFNPKKELHILTYFSGAKQRIGYSRKWAFCLTDTIADEKYKGDRHEVMYNLDLVSVLTGKSYTEDDVNYVLKNLFEIDNVLKGSLPDRITVVHPFTSDPRKELGWDKWEDIVRECLKNGKFVCLIGSKEEKEKALIFTQRFNSPNLLNLVGKLDLYQLGALLKYHTSEFWGLDSGPAHFAGLLGLPVNVFWSYASWTRWKPWGRRVLKFKVPFYDQFS